MAVIRRLIAELLGPPAEPESTALLRRYGQQLTEQATALRETAARARVLDARAQALGHEARAWTLRLDRARGRGVTELVEAAALQLGRSQGQLEAALHERDLLLDEELRTRRVLVEQRTEWLRLVGEAQRMGHDLSSVVTHIDLTAPPPVAEDLLPDDEERDFVARAIDGLH